MMAKATVVDLHDILRQLNPNVPAGQDGNAIPRTPRDSSALRTLRISVSADPVAKCLLAGHIGAGKSTELLNLAREMEQDRHVIQCSIARTLGVHNVDTFSLLIVVLEASIRSWVDFLGEMPRGLVEELVGHVRNLVPDNRRGAKRTGKPRTAPTDLAEALMELVLRMAPEEITTGRQLATLYSSVVQRLALRYVQPEQLAMLEPSHVAMSCELVLKELNEKAGKPVLLIIDDLDKVRDENAQIDIFLERSMAWMRLPCGVVATLPLDLLFSTRGRELDEIWGGVAVLDPLPVPALDGTSAREAALQPYLEMLRSIGAHTVFSALQCRRLAHIASGLPRSFINACGACVRHALEANETHVRDYHVELVHRDLADRWRGRLLDADYDALLAVIDSSGGNVPRAGHLLRDGLLIRDGGASGTQQFRLATWVEELVEAYRQRRPADYADKRKGIPGVS